MGLAAGKASDFSFVGLQYLPYCETSLLVKRVMYTNTSLSQVAVLDPIMNYLANGRQYIAIFDGRFNDTKNFIFALPQ